MGFHSVFLGFHSVVLGFHRVLIGYSMVFIMFSWWVHTDFIGKPCGSVSVVNKALNPFSPKVFKSPPSAVNHIKPSKTLANHLKPSKSLPSKNIHTSSYQKTTTFQTPALPHPAVFPLSGLLSPFDALKQGRTQTMRHDAH